jgi:hypothetical protein
MESIYIAAAILVVSLVIGLEWLIGDAARDWVERRGRDSR